MTIATTSADTAQKMLDAVDAGFDAQLAATRDFVTMLSIRGAASSGHDRRPRVAAEIDQGVRALHRRMVWGGESVVATTTSDVIAKLDPAIHHLEEIAFKFDGGTGDHDAT